MATHVETQVETATVAIEAQSNWDKLLPELVERIAACLPRNVVACSLRCVNKAAAALLSSAQCKVVHLSEPVPEHAFAARWGPNPHQGNAVSDAFRGLTRKQRLQLLCLTAASGSVPNLECLAAGAALAGCILTEVLMSAAAAAGKLDVCRWLQERGVLPEHRFNALESAAEAGRREACAWLLQNGYSCSDRAVCAAACGGHADTMDWLLQQLDGPLPREGLVSVAAGCDLPTLQRLCGVAGAAPADGAAQPLASLEHSITLPQGTRTASMLEAAAQSPAPDWRAKVEWLEGQGCARTATASALAAARPDAVERLEWLRRRGYPLDGAAVHAAAGRGNATAVQYLVAECGVPPCREARIAAACGGHVAVLEVLRCAGCPMDAHLVMHEAAAAGQLPAVAWAVEVLDGDEHLGEDLFDQAAESGDLALMKWLRGRGCPWDASMFSAAATSGNVVALEWLAEQGCPLPDYHMCYYHAISCAEAVSCAEDMLTLRCLRRLGCPWGDPFVIQNAFFCFRPDWVQGRLQLLSWLRDEACPLDWAAMRRTASKRGYPEIVQWLDENLMPCLLD